MDIRELQEKLIGVYDFTKVSDCHSVISMLLKDLELEKKRAGLLDSKLKSLVLATVEDNSDSKSRAASIASGTREKIGVMGFLERMGLRMTDAEKMTDEQLREALLKIWAEYDMDSEESGILGEVIARLQK